MLPGIMGVTGFNATATGEPAGIDSYFANTVLLLSCDGADGSNTFTDQSFVARGNATVSGQAQVDTAQFKFGSGSLLLDGTDDKLSYADSADWNFGSGDFTVEMWVRFNSLTGFQTFASQWQTSSQLSWLFDFPGSANNVLRFAYSTDGSASTAVQGAWTPSANTWYHVAASRSGNTLYLFADGTQIVTGNVTGVTFFNSTALLRIGTILQGGEANDFNGWMDEVRITKGVGRYTAAFTAPTAAFPRA